MAILSSSCPILKDAHERLVVDGVWLSIWTFLLEVRLEGTKNFLRVEDLFYLGAIRKVMVGHSRRCLITKSLMILH